MALVSWGRMGYKARKASRVRTMRLLPPIRREMGMGDSLKDGRRQLKLLNGFTMLPPYKQQLLRHQKAHP